MKVFDFINNLTVPQLAEFINDSDLFGFDFDTFVFLNRIVSVQTICKYLNLDM